MQIQLQMANKIIKYFYCTNYCPLRNLIFFSPRGFNVTIFLEMIDCHAHLGEFEGEMSEMINRAKSENVIGAVMVPEYRKNFERNMALAEKYSDFLFPALGLHPIQGSYGVPEESSACSLEDFEKSRDYIRENHERIVCVGEAGLDFTPKFMRKETDKADQIAALRGQIELAMEFGLPLNLHSRSASPQLFSLLDEYGYYNCLFHAYGGKAKKAAFYAKKGCFFSVPNTAAKEGSQMVSYGDNFWTKNKNFGPKIKGNYF